MKIAQNNRFIETHLNAFISASHESHDKVPVGAAPADWARRFGLRDVPDSKRLPEKMLTRSELKAICRDENISSLHAYVCVMAWGVQGAGPAGGRNVLRSWDQRNQFYKQLDRLREGILAPDQAYEQFATPEIAGLGPSYFTKLIAFMDPHDRSFIMDQWTSKSVNLLTGKEIVALINGTPARSNTGENYLEFCGIVTQVAQVASIEPWLAEERLFSKGGRKKEEWRRHVVQNWRPH